MSDQASILLQLRIQTAQSALAVYEYMVTIDQEVSAVWKRPVSAASVLLVSIRWAMLLQALTALLSDGALRSESCRAEVILQLVAVLSLFLSTAVFSALRVYALWDKSIALACVVFLLQSSPFVVNMYIGIHFSYKVIPEAGCSQLTHFDENTFIILARAARIPAIFGDALVVTVTWAKSFGQIRRARQLGISVPLSSLLFRDGTAYFLLLLGINAIELCTRLSEAGEAFAGLAVNLPPILINRFLLNLRQLNESETACPLRTISVPTFRMSIDVTGNLGETLNHGWSAGGDDDRGDHVVNQQKVSRAESGQ